MSYTATLDSTNNLLSLAHAKHNLGIDTGEEQRLDVLCLGEDAGTGISAEYFLFSTTLFDYYVWYDVDAGSVDPAVTGRTGIEVDVSDHDSATSIATDTAAAITAVTGVTATSDGSTVHIVNDAAGSVTAPTAGTSPFTVTERVEGTSGDPAYDKIVTDIINQVSWFLKEECNRVLKSQSLTEYYDTKGGVILYLLNPPVASLTLYQDAARSFATAVDSDDYEIEATSGRILLTGTTFIEGQHVVKAAYTGGYSTIPYDIENAAAEMIGQRYELTDHHAFSTKSRSNDKGGTTSYKHEISEMVERVITKYRKVGFC